jgi:hypothetical protein
MIKYTWQQVNMDTGSLFSTARGVLTSHTQALAYLGVSHEDRVSVNTYRKDGMLYHLTLIMV